MMNNIETMQLTYKHERTLSKRGRVYWNNRKTQTFYKVYNRDCLLDDPSNIEARLRLIVQLTNIMEFLPKTNYFYEKDILRMNQKRLIKQKDLREIEQTKRLPLVSQFAQSLDEVYDEGFIHGDINRKNIIYSENRLCLVDLEPSLLQIKDRVKQWMSTKPYVCDEDIQNNNISAKTDLLGFCCFVKWFLLNDKSPQEYSKDCTEIINNFRKEISPFKNLTRILII